MDISRIKHQLRTQCERYFEALPQFREGIIQNIALLSRELLDSENASDLPHSLIDLLMQGADLPSTQKEYGSGAVEKKLRFMRERLGEGDH